MKNQFLWVFFFASVLLAQNKIDSLFQFNNRNDNSIQFKTNDMTTNNKSATLPLQYLQFQCRRNLLDDKFLSSNKILYSEITEGYKFSADELNCGLTDDQLIAYMKNKKFTLKILADIYYQHADVNWDKIQKILGISEQAFAFILAFASLLKYH